MFKRKSVCKRGHLRIPENVYPSGHCKPCAIRRQYFYQAKNSQRKAWQRNYQITRKYKITQADYELKFMQQNGKCLICREPNKLVIDHNHETGQVRGLLCNNCNAMIGFARESQDTLRIAAGYLSQWDS